MRAIEIGAALLLSGGAFGSLVGATVGSATAVSATAVSATAASATAVSATAASARPEAPPGEAVAPAVEAATPQPDEAPDHPAAALPQAASRPPAAERDPAPPSAEPEGIAVPSFEGMSGLEAWRAGRQLGLRVLVRDPNGDRVEQWGARDVRIDDRQTPAPGTRVETGTLVRLRSRDPRAMVASGY